MLCLWLRKLQVKAAFVDNVFSMLEKSVANLPTAEHSCALLLDEVSLKRGLTCDEAIDEVNSFEDRFPQRRTHREICKSRLGVNSSHRGSSHCIPYLQSSVVVRQAQREMETEKNEGQGGTEG